MRDVQLLSIICFLLSYKENNGEFLLKNILQQINTGEGKSIIVCSISIVFAMFGYMVDVVTSSSVLATRDSEENQALMKLMGIDVDNCCYSDEEQRKKVYTSNHVIYGDIGSFQRDHLDTVFYGKDIRTSRKYHVIIIDEVDSLVIDKG